MNIFLDTNVFFNDSFLRKGKKPVLLRLAQHKDVKIFINHTVYEELKRKHQQSIQQQVDTAEEALSKIKHLFKENREIMNIDIKTENLMEDLTSHFETLQSEGQLQVLEYNVEVLKDIVEVDMYDKEPFVKQLQETKKSGEIFRYKKKEIRDSIIWFTYKRYIEKNGLENCIFISHNWKDFGVNGASKTPKGQPYKLHKNLSQSCNITAYRDVDDFLTHNAGPIKELFKDRDLHERILSGDFAEQVEKELKEGLAKELTSKHFEETILSYTDRYLSNLFPESIHDDYSMGGFVQPNFIRQLNNIELEEFDVYGGDIAVSVTLDVHVDVDIYLYNPGRDDQSDKYQYYTTDVVKVEERVIFILPIDEEKEVGNTKFSLREYIKDVEPSDVDIEVLERKTIEHEPMFEEDYDENYPI